MLKAEIQARIDVLLLDLGALSYKAETTGKKIEGFYLELKPEDVVWRQQATLMSDELERLLKEYRTMQDTLFELQAMLE